MMISFLHCESMWEFFMIRSLDLYLIIRSDLKFKGKNEICVV
jgi:hypothetical protein